MTSTDCSTSATPLERADELLPDRGAGATLGEAR
jgi:hypothetical protein